MRPAIAESLPIASRTQASLERLRGLLVHHDAQILALVLAGLGTMVIAQGLVAL